MNRTSYEDICSVQLFAYRMLCLYFAMVSLITHFDTCLKKFMKQPLSREQP